MHPCGTPELTTIAAYTTSTLYIVQAVPCHLWVDFSSKNNALLIKNITWHFPVKSWCTWLKTGIAFSSYASAMQIVLGPPRAVAFANVLASLHLVVLIGTDCDTEMTPHHVWHFPFASPYICTASYTIPPYSSTDVFVIVENLHKQHLVTNTV